MRRILVIGIVAALLIGVLVATATASVERTVEGVDDSPMTIPETKVGDEALYAWFTKSSAETVEGTIGAAVGGASSNGATHASASSHVSSNEAWAQNSLELFRVEDVGKSLDKQGRIHDVVVVRANYTSSDYSGTSVSHVELAERSVVRKDHKDVFNRPDEDFSFSSFSTAGENVYFEHQGQTYRLGQEIPIPDANKQCSGFGIGHGYHGGSNVAGIGRREVSFSVSHFDCDELAMAPKIISMRSWVAERGVVDGHQAYDIRTETVLRVAEVAISHDSDGKAQVMPGQEYDLKTIRDQWISADLPYPILEENVAFRDGKEVGRWQRVLQEYNAGSQDVAWGGQFDPNPPILERGMGPHPGDGSHSKLPYTLSQAVADANGPLAPLPFQVWKQSHPAATLVSARLTLGENSRAAQPSSMWVLVFSEPDGAAHEVATERFQGVAQPLVTDRGDEAVPAFSPEILPRNLVTLAEIERAWTVLAPSEYVSRGPNYVLWGLDVDQSEGLTCFGFGDSSGGESAEDALRTVYLGWTTEGSCAEVPPDIDASVLAFEAAAGELLALIQYHESWDISPEPGPTHRAEVSHQAMAGAVRIAKPDIAVATVTSSSLLAIFLAAYFLPAIKVVGAQALLILPGYAKLRKDAILDNKIRDQILENIKQDPGVSITDLAKKVDAGWGTVVYHLGVLEKNKMVSTVLDGRHRRVFPVGLVDFSSQGQIAILKNERIRALYELIHDEPGVIQDQLAKRIGISAPAAGWHLKRLEDAGLVGRVKDGRRVHYYANEKPEVHTPDGMEVA